MYIRWKKIVDEDDIERLLKTYASYLSKVLGISEEEAFKRLDYFYNHGLKDLILLNPNIGETVKKSPQGCEVKILKINLYSHRDYDFLTEIVQEFEALLWFKQVQVDYIVCWQSKSIIFLTINFKF